MSRIIGHGLKTLLAVFAVAMLLNGQARAQCLGDCDGNGKLSAGEVTKIIAIILNCNRQAAGCPAVAGGVGCTNADKNHDGTISAGELTQIIFDVINFPATFGCPPVASPTPGAATPTNTTAPTQTPTNTLAPTNTPANPATPTNTAVLPTNTRAATATATRPAATKTPTPGPICGDGITQAGEDCDPGGVCTGGTNAGTKCTSEAGCTGNGVCDSGPLVETSCPSTAFCNPSGTSGVKCVHCKTFGGAGCAANCTAETNIPFNLVPGVPVMNAFPPAITAGTSGSLVVGGSLKLALPLTGSQTITLGKPANGLVPFVVKGASVHINKIQVGTIACACVRALPGKTCGGTIFEQDGSASIDCTPQYTAGTCSSGAHACTADADCPDAYVDSAPAIALNGNKCVSGTCTCHLDSDCGSGGSCVVSVCNAVGKPCSFINGAGNSASGNIGCTGLDGVNLNFTQQSVLTSPPPAQRQNGIAPPGSGLPVLTFSGHGGPGSAIVLNTSAIGTTQGTADDGVTIIHPNKDFCTGVASAIPHPSNPGFCDGTAFGHDCSFCTDDDPQSGRGPVGTLPQTTGTATATITGSWASGPSTCCTDTTGVTCANPLVSCPLNACPTNFSTCAQNIGPKTATGNPLAGLSCALPFVPPASITGFATAGAFTELNQPSTSDIVVTNVFVAQ